MATQSFDIVDGPSREALFDALRLIAEKRIVSVSWISPDEERRTNRIVPNSILNEPTANPRSMHMRAPGFFCKLYLNYAKNSFPHNSYCGH